jgi:hydrogenase maturation protease
MQMARKVILIDATADDLPPGSVRRLEPQSSQDYPRTLTANNIGLMDLLDAYHAGAKRANVVLFAISIRPLRQMALELSREIAARLEEVVQLVMGEIKMPAASEPRISTVAS